MDQAQPAERQQVVDLVDRLAEGDDGFGQPARGNERSALTQLGRDPPCDAVDQPGEAEDDARLDRGAAGAADRRFRFGERPCLDSRRCAARRADRLDPRRGAGKDPDPACVALDEMMDDRPRRAAGADLRCR